MKTSKKQTQYVIRDKNSNKYANVKYQIVYPDDNEIESHGFEDDSFRATRYGNVQDAQRDMEDIKKWEEKVDLIIDEITYSAEIDNPAVKE